MGVATPLKGRGLGWNFLQFCEHTFDDGATKLK